MTTPISAAVRRIAVLAVSGITVAGLSVVLSVVVATPANADVPEGWPDADPIDTLGAIGLLAGVPLLLALLIGLAVYVPALARGERVAPGAPEVEDQWLGGPRKGLGELAGPDSVDSEAGGASGRW